MNIKLCIITGILAPACICVTGSFAAMSEDIPADVVLSTVEQTRIEAVQEYKKVQAQQQRLAEQQPVRSVPIMPKDIPAVARVTEVRPNKHQDIAIGVAGIIIAISLITYISLKSKRC